MNMSLSTCLLTGTVLLIPASVVADQAPAASPPSLASSVPAPRTQALALKFTLGQTLYYKLVEDTVGSYLEPGSELTPIKSHLEMQIHQTVSGLRDTDSAGLIDVGIDSMTVTIDSQPSPPSAGDLALMANLARLVVLPNGKLGETLANPAVNADDALTGEDPVHMNPLSGLGELPAKPLQMGDKWNSPVYVGLMGEQTTAKLSLTGWETKDAASVAVIKQVLQGKFATPPKKSGNPMSDTKISGRVSGVRTVRFNVEAGTVESMDALCYLGVQMAQKEDDGKYSIAPTRLWIKLTSKLTRIAAPSPPPVAVTPPPAEADQSEAAPTETPPIDKAPAEAP